MVQEDELRVADGGLAVENRECLNFLLMGQGGFGKTALVRDFVLPALDLSFTAAATLIVGGKWSQADDVSTAGHKTMTCHRACYVCIQKMRDCDVRVISCLRSGDGLLTCAASFWKRSA